MDIETKMKELMDFVQDVAKGLYYMDQRDIAASYPIDGKQVKIDIKITVEDQSNDR